jgi:ribosomal protein S18 acetylase RimI-like enzyme
MSTSETAATRLDDCLVVRDAVPADYPAIREVVLAAYGQYAYLVAPDVFEPYLDDVLDLEKHARNGQWLVVQADGRIQGSVAFYPDAAAQGVGLPPGWASGRGLAVDPAVRGRGVARALIAAADCLAEESGAPVFAFHTASFMTSAIALYERLGYCRAPEFDYNMAAHYSPSATPIMSIAFYRRLGNAAQLRRIK